MATTAGLKAAMSSVPTSRDYTSRDLLAEVEARMARGRLATLIGEHDEDRRNGVDDLRNVVRFTAGGLDGLSLSVAGSVDLLRVNAFYFLGHALVEAGNVEEGHECLNEVVAMDPASEFGVSAYEALHLS